jgi:hypothetical protein
MKKRIYYIIPLFLLLTSFLPLLRDTSENFSASGVCSDCHSASGAVMTVNGNDVSPISHWRSTMMANSNRDPLWKAKVIHETITNDHIKDVIEEKCLTCHAPMGHTQKLLDGAGDYLYTDLLSDRMSHDGVSCTVCHQIIENGTSAGEYNIKTNKMIYGPYTNPIGMAMQNFTGFTPAYSDFVDNSLLCASCHTLYTPFLDGNGEVAGTFPEQTPYLEWLNSSYSKNSQNCQSCHMPIIEDGVILSSMPPSANTKRSPFWKHYFVGANTLIPKVLRNNPDVFQVTASETHFDSTLDRAKAQMVNNTVKFTATHETNDNELAIVLNIENLTGHKLPTGIPIRRMWIHLTVYDEFSNIIFESGGWNENGELNSNTFQPHFDEISSEDQVQIYEGVMENVSGEETYVLLEAANYKKDNRLLPKGWSNDSEHYSDIKPFGDAEMDEDFVGGSDKIVYKINIDNNSSIHYKAELCFQPVKPAFIKHLFEEEAEEIDEFKNIFDEKDLEPEIIATIDNSITSVNDDDQNNSFEVYPNPFTKSFRIELISDVTFFGKLELLSLNGELLYDKSINVSEGLNSISLSPDMIQDNIIIVKISSEKKSYSKIILRY